MQQPPEPIGILDGFDRLVPLGQRHIGFRDVVLANDGADEHRLLAVHEGKEVVLQAAARDVERIASRLAFFPHHGRGGD